MSALAGCHGTGSMGTQCHMAAQCAAKQQLEGLTMARVMVSLLNSADGESEWKHTGYLSLPV